MCTWLQKKVLIPLVFSPPQLPPVPSSYRAWRCVSWTGFALFQVLWESGAGVTPEEECLQLPKHWGFATVGRGLGAPQCSGLGLLHLLRATITPQEPRRKPTASVGASRKPCTLQTANLSLHGAGSTGQACRSKRRAAGRVLCPSLGDGGSGQETGRLVQLPVPCRRRDGRRQACGSTLRQPVASRRHLSRSRIPLRCGDGARWVPSSLSSPCPGSLAHGPRDELTWSLRPAWPPPSLLPPSRRTLLPRLALAFPLRSRSPPRGHGQVHAAPLSHRPARPPRLGCCWRGTGRALRGAGDGVAGP